MDQTSSLQIFNSHALIIIAASPTTDQQHHFIYLLVSIMCIVTVRKRYVVYYWQIIWVSPNIKIVKISKFMFLFTDVLAKKG